MLSSIDQLTIEWLNERWRARGLPGGGALTAFAVAARRETHVSSSCRLQLTYRAGAPAGPRRLFLKIANPDFDWGDWGDKEARFYADLLPAMRARFDWDALPFVRAYDWDHDPAGGSYLLLADIGDDYAPAPAGQPPTPAHAGQLMAALARLHAFWWESPRLFADLGQRLTEEQLNAFCNRAQERLADLRRFRGPALAAADAADLARIAAAWPARRRARLLAGQGVTLVHRDTHPDNVLFSQGDDGVYLIDWQSWRVDCGTDDVAYLMACHWPAGYRAEQEQPLLRAYLAALQADGVGDYDWAQCWYDYRASICRCLFFLIAAWSPAQWERGWWWEKVQCGLAAYRALNCAALL